MATSLQTTTLKLPKYAGTDKADLIGGYNSAMDMIDQEARRGTPVYTLPSGDAALPAGARRPCLIIVPSKGEIWYDDGK